MTLILENFFLGKIYAKYIVKLWNHIVDKNYCYKI